MALYDQPNLTAGIDSVITSTAKSVPALPIMILIFTFILVFIGGSSNQKRRLGTGDYPFWAVLSGLTIVFESLIMTTGDGLIDITTLSIVFAVATLCGIWFFLSKRRGEI